MRSGNLLFTTIAIGMEFNCTRDVAIDKRGTSGSNIKMMSNYVVLKNRPGRAIYQYNIGG